MREFFYVKKVFDNMAQRVAVVGAGCSGLTAVKCCLDEGLKPFCFESEDDIGGLWNYADESKPGKVREINHFILYLIFISIILK